MAGFLHILAILPLVGGRPISGTMTPWMVSTPSTDGTGPRAGGTGRAALGVGGRGGHLRDPGRLGGVPVGARAC